LDGERMTLNSPGRPVQFDEHGTPVGYVRHCDFHLRSVAYSVRGIFVRRPNGDWTLDMPNSIFVDMERSARYPLPPKARRDLSAILEIVANQLMTQQRERDLLLRHSLDGWLGQLNESVRQKDQAEARYNACISAVDALRRLQRPLHLVAASA
jgi:hypothetical protein